jgi:hypothetical protein
MKNTKNLYPVVKTVQIAEVIYNPGDLAELGEQDAEKFKEFLDLKPDKILDLKPDKK